MHHLGTHFLPLHLLIACIQWMPITPYPSGAPYEACDSLQPNETAHRGGALYTSVPYFIDLSPLPSRSRDRYYYTPSTPYTRKFEKKMHVAFMLFLQSLHEVETITLSKAF